ncbi:hypothetical protein B0H19DRAFT_1382834 [Mycena capillaripes]|nr:hypothetical protein B0H19DRAFT_1382834 [Mycena capillaripes]
MYNDVGHLTCSLDHCAAHFSSGWALVHHLSDSHALLYSVKLQLPHDQQSRVYVRRMHGILDCPLPDGFGTPSMKGLLEHLRQFHAHDFTVLEGVIEHGLRDPERASLKATVCLPYTHALSDLPTVWVQVLNPGAPSPEPPKLNDVRPNAPVRKPGRRNSISSFFTATMRPSVPSSESQLAVTSIIYPTPLSQVASSPLPPSSSPAQSTPVSCNPLAKGSAKRPRSPSIYSSQRTKLPRCELDPLTMPSAIPDSVLPLQHRDTSRMVMPSPTVNPDSPCARPPASALALCPTSAPGSATWQICAKDAAAAHLNVDWGNHEPFANTDLNDPQTTRLLASSTPVQVSTPSHFVPPSPYQRQPAKARLLNVDDVHGGVSFENRLFGVIKVSIPDPPYEPRLRFTTPSEHGSSSPSPCPPQRRLTKARPVAAQNTADFASRAAALVQDDGLSPASSGHSETASYSPCCSASMDNDGLDHRSADVGNHELFANTNLDDPQTARSLASSTPVRASTPHHFLPPSSYQKQPAKVQLLNVDDVHSGASFEDRLLGVIKVSIPDPPREPRLRFATPSEHGSSSPSPCPPPRPLTKARPVVARNTTDSAPGAAAFAQDGGLSPASFAHSQTSSHSPGYHASMENDGLGAPSADATPPGLKPLILTVEMLLFNRSAAIHIKLKYIRSLSLFFHDHCAACWTLTGRTWPADHEPFSICRTRMHPDVVTTATAGPELAAMQPAFREDAACSRCWLPQITIGAT